jgi:hypothetical protein
MNWKGRSDGRLSYTVRAPFLGDPQRASCQDGTWTRDYRKQNRIAEHSLHRPIWGLALHWWLRACKQVSSCQFCLCLIKHHGMKMHEAEVWLHAFLISMLGYISGKFFVLTLPTPTGHRQGGPQGWSECSGESNYPLYWMRNGSRCLVLLWLS